GVDQQRGELSRSRSAEHGLGVRGLTDAALDLLAEGRGREQRDVVEVEPALAQPPLVRAVPAAARAEERPGGDDLEADFRPPEQKEEHGFTPMGAATNDGLRPKTQPVTLVVATTCWKGPVYTDSAATRPCRPAPTADMRTVLSALFLA